MNRTIKCSLALAGLVVNAACVLYVRTGVLYVRTELSVDDNISIYS
jgi:spore maturation protein SpmA